MAYSVIRPMAMPIITHRPLLISFFFVQPNTLRRRLAGKSRCVLGGGQQGAGAAEAQTGQRACCMGREGAGGLKRSSLSSLADSGLDVLICTQSPTQDWRCVQAAAWW